MAEDHGTVFFREVDDNLELDIKIQGVAYTGKKNERKNGDAHPDYRLFQGNDEVGAAWKGTTKNDRVKLSIKLSNGTYMTAVMQDKEEDEDDKPDMVVLPPTPPK